LKHFKKKNIKIYFGILRLCIIQEAFCREEKKREFNQNEKKILNWILSCELDFLISL
jgi:hypothetical protein